MIKGMIVIFLLVFCLSALVSSEDWAGINVDDDDSSGSGDSGGESSGGENDDSGSGEPAQTYSPDSGNPKLKYTNNFYIALGVGTMVILIILYFVYLFIKGPTVKWKKPKPIKQ